MINASKKVSGLSKEYTVYKKPNSLYLTNVVQVAPVRKGWSRGFYRKKLAVKFLQKLYNKRSRIESIFHWFKQRFGSSVSAKLAKTARAEIYCRAILYNLFIWLCRLLRQSLC